MIRSQASLFYAQSLIPLNQGYEQFPNEKKDYTHSEGFSDLAKKHDIKLAKGYKKLFPSLHGTSIKNNKKNLKQCFKEEIEKNKPTSISNTHLWDNVEKELEFGLSSPKPLSKRKFKSLKTHTRKLSEKFHTLNNHKQNTISSLETTLNTYLNSVLNDEATQIIRSLNDDTLSELIQAVSHNVFFEHSDKLEEDYFLNSEARIRLDSYLTKSSITPRVNANIVKLTKIMKDPNSISMEILNSIKELDLSLLIQKAINKNAALNKLTNHLDFLETQYPLDTYEIRNLLKKLDRPFETTQQEEVLKTINLLTEKIEYLRISKKKKKTDLYHPLIDLAHSLDFSQVPKKNSSDKREITTFSYERNPFPFLENLFSFLENPEHKSIKKAIDINHWGQRLENSDILEANSYCQEFEMYNQYSLIESVKKFGLD